MSPVYKYAIEIFYSEEDDGYIAVVPELAGCSAYGDNEEQALREIKTAIDLWISTAKNMGRDIPKPHGREVLRDLLDQRSRLNAMSSE
jgi:predicted RNase H-like HicB family nuclease